MAAFIGRHINKIDKKGRVSVPKPFRDAIADQDYPGIYVFPSFKYPALEGAGEAFIQRIVTSLDDLDLFSDEQDDLAETILANTNTLPYDPEGRVILPKSLMDHVNLKTEAVFVGAGARFQIWEPKAYAVHNAQSFERARARGVTLRLRTSDDGTGGGS